MVHGLKCISADLINPTSFTEQCPRLSGLWVFRLAELSVSVWLVEHVDPGLLKKSHFQRPPPRNIYVSLPGVPLRTRMYAIYAIPTTAGVVLHTLFMVHGEGHDERSHPVQGQGWFSNLWLLSLFIVVPLPCPMAAFSNFWPIRKFPSDFFRLEFP
ncbi:hypothetical protein F4779DRAFT_520120 [Xylariaceae sp. FL0662B]|nr:hypothetical protein F4779DRAFT_520120 [Xylariaceae sp. FL0662B]